MLGLLGTLDLANRSLQTSRQGTEVAGHNLANVNNPAYARQRLNVQTSLALPSSLGAVGTGVDAASITQLRDSILDRQVQTETSVRSSLEAQQSALQYAEAALGQQIDRQAAGPDGTTSANGIGSQPGLAENLSDLFNSFQGLSSNPTSLAERQNVLSAAQQTATQFNQVSQRLSTLHSSLDDSLQDSVKSFNDGLRDVADLNQRIISAELGARGTANDLRDLRQQKIENLSKLAKVDTATASDGSISVSLGGVALVNGAQLTESIETYDAGGGQLLVRAQTSGSPLTLTGGSMEGTIQARDGALTNLRTQLDALASSLVTNVNAIHKTGFGLNNSTGEDFFSGTNAATIRVNQKLIDNPALLQASGASGAPGDNQTILAMAQLGQQRQPALRDQTFQESYATSVTALGQSLASVNTQLNSQQIVDNMLQRQRDAVSGVSLDEEMTDLMKYQKAFEASAKLVVTIDEMLDTVLNLKR